VKEDYGELRHPVIKEVPFITIGSTPRWPDAVRTITSGSGPTQGRTDLAAIGCGIRGFRGQEFRAPSIGERSALSRFDQESTDPAPISWASRRNGRKCSGPRQLHRPRRKARTNLRPAQPQLPSETQRQTGASRPENQRELVFQRVWGAQSCHEASWANGGLSGRRLLGDNPGTPQSRRCRARTLLIVAPRPATPVLRPSSRDGAGVVSATPNSGSTSAGSRPGRCDLNGSDLFRSGLYGRFPCTLLRPGSGFTRTAAHSTGLQPSS